MYHKKLYSETAEKIPEIIGSLKKANEHYKIRLVWFKTIMRDWISRLAKLKLGRSSFSLKLIKPFMKKDFSLFHSLLLVLIAGFLVVFYLYAQNGRYVADEAGVLDTRTGTVYDWDGLNRFEIDESSRQ